METYQCLDCNRFVQLNQHGRCGKCDSQAVASELLLEEEVAA